jgi:hypothetical protein
MRTWRRNYRSRCVRPNPADEACISASISFVAPLEKTARCPQLCRWPARLSVTYLMSATGVRREKAALSSGCKSHPAIAPAGSNRSNHGGNEVAEAFGYSDAFQRGESYELRLDFDGNHRNLFSADDRGCAPPQHHRHFGVPGLDFHWMGNSLSLGLHCGGAAELRSRTYSRKTNAA